MCFEYFFYFFLHISRIQNIIAFAFLDISTRVPATLMTKNTPACDARRYAAMIKTSLFWEQFLATFFTLRRLKLILKHVTFSKNACLNSVKRCLISRYISERRHFSWHKQTGYCSGKRAVEKKKKKKKKEGHEREVEELVRLHMAASRFLKEV